MNVQIFVSDQEKLHSTSNCRTSTFQKSFFPSAITGWNSLGLDVRNSVSLPTFKTKTRSILFPYTYNRLYDYSFTRRASVDHTRLWLGFSCLREYLFKINSCVAYLRVQFWLWIVDTFFLVLPKVCRSTWCSPYLCCYCSRWNEVIEWRR